MFPSVLASHQDAEQGDVLLLRPEIQVKVVLCFCIHHVRTHSEQANACCDSFIWFILHLSTLLTAAEGWVWVHSEWLRREIHIPIGTGCGDAGKSLKLSGRTVLPPL